MVKNVVTLYIDDTNLRLLVAKGDKVKKWADLPLEYGLVNKVVPYDELEEETNRLAEAATSLPMDGIVMGKTFLQGIVDAAGAGMGEYIGYLGHAMQTAIHYQPGEFNLLKERRDKGIKGATIGRDTHWSPDYDLR